MTKYDVAYDPPAPIAKVALKKIDSKERLSGVEVFLDTGSDITLLPRKALDNLKFNPSTIEKYSLIGFDGTIVESEIYELQIDFLGRRFTGKYCAVDDSVGILGRDVLNQVAILFDGPNSEWDEIVAPQRG